MIEQPQLSRRLFLSRGALLAAGAIALPNHPDLFRRFFFMPEPPIAVKLYTAMIETKDGLQYFYSLQEAVAALPRVINDNVIIHAFNGTYELVTPRIDGSRFTIRAGYKGG